MALPATNLTFHLDASDSSTLWKETTMSTHPSNGDEVRAWDDVGDATNYAFLYNGVTASPSYVASGINGLGSLAWIANRLIGMRDDGNTTSPAASTFISAATGTIFAAIKITTSGGGNSSLAYQNPAILAGGVHWGLYNRTISGVDYVEAYAFDGASKTARKSFVIGDVMVVMWKHASGVLTVDINDSGSPVTAACGNIADLSARIEMGSSINHATFIGQCGEIAIYNGDVTGTDLSDAWAYFITKWGDTQSSSVSPSVSASISPSVSPSPSASTSPSSSTSPSPSDAPADLTWQPDTALALSTPVLAYTSVTSPILPDDGSASASASVSPSSSASASASPSVSSSASQSTSPSASPSSSLPPAEFVEVTTVHVELAAPAEDADVRVINQVAEIVTALPAGDVVVDHAIIEILRPIEVAPDVENEDDAVGAIGPIVWVEMPWESEP